MQPTALEKSSAPRLSADVRHTKSTSGQGKQYMADKTAAESEAAAISRAFELAYQAASDHWTHAEQVRWSLLYNFLMAVTILLLAWAAVAGATFEPKRLVLLSLCGAGFVLSLVWFGLSRRAGLFVHHYAEFGRSVERDQLLVVGPFRSAKAFRDDIKGLATLMPSRVVLPLVPALFAVLCVILAYGSIQISQKRASVPNPPLQPAAPTTK
jgi:hypothetical protein